MMTPTIADYLKYANLQMAANQKGSTIEIGANDGCVWKPHGA